MRWRECHICYVEEDTQRSDGTIAKMQECSNCYEPYCNRHGDIYKDNQPPYLCNDCKDKLGMVAHNITKYDAEMIKLYAMFSADWVLEEIEYRKAHNRERSSNHDNLSGYTFADLEMLYEILSFGWSDK